MVRTHIYGSIPAHRAGMLPCPDVLLKLSVLDAGYFPLPARRFPRKKKTPERCFGVVDDTGLEPVTLRTSSGCSYQLS